MIVGNNRHERNWLDLDTGNQSEIIDKAAIIVMESFFKRLRTKSPSIAVETLFSSNPDINAQLPAAVNLKRSFVTIHQDAGQLMEYRLLKKRFVEDDFGIYCYLVKYEKVFLRFLFTFYNNSNTIKLYKFSFDDNLDNELERSLNLQKD